VPTKDVIANKLPTLGPEDVQFVRLEGETAIPVGFQLLGEFGHYTIVPDESLSHGATYVLWSSRTCETLASGDMPPLDILMDDSYDVGFYGKQGIGRAIAHFKAIEKAPLPTSLGALVAQPAKRQPVEYGTGAACFEELDAITVDIALAEPSPFHDALEFTTLVDGEVFRPTSRLGYQPPVGNSWQGHGIDQLYSLCDWEDRFTRQLGLEEGLHEVQLVATLPGTDTVIKSDVIMVELDCKLAAEMMDELDSSVEGINGPEDTGVDGGGDLIPDPEETSGEDRPSPREDETQGDRGVGASVDVSTDLAQGELMDVNREPLKTNETSSGGGCNVNSPSGGADAGLVALLASLGLVVFRRLARGNQHRPNRG